MGKKILIVDDSPSILQMVAFTLSGAGYETDQAGDGEAAFKKAGSSPFNLVITDLNMPKMDGLTLTQKLRAHSSYRLIPILMLTTENSDAFKAKGKAAGATGWLVKPFDPQKLLGVVKKLIG